MKLNQSLLSIALVVSIASVQAGRPDDHNPGGNGVPFDNLQQQIDIINLNLEQLTLVVEDGIQQLQAQIDALAIEIEENTDNIDLINSQQQVQDDLINALSVAIEIIESKVQQNSDDIDAISLLNQLQDQRLSAIEQQLSNHEGRIAQNSLDADALFAADQLMQQRVSLLENRANNLQLQISRNDGDISRLQSDLASTRTQLQSAQTALANKQNRITNFCSSGTYATGIRQYSTSAQLYCQYANNRSYSLYTGTQTRTFSRVRFCASEILGICADYEYYSYGTAYCPSGYRATGGGFSIGSRSTNHRVYRAAPGYSSYSVSTANSDHDNGLTVYVSCLKFNQLN